MRKFLSKNIKYLTHQVKNLSLPGQDSMMLWKSKIFSHYLLFGPSAKRGLGQSSFWRMFRSKLEEKLGDKTENPSMVVQIPETKPLSRSLQTHHLAEISKNQHSLRGERRSVARAPGTQASEGSWSREQQRAAKNHKGQYAKKGI